MIGLDTNVVVRFIVRDDAEQTALADKVVASLDSKKQGYLSLIVLTELWWVLDRTYRRSVTDRHRLFVELLHTDELTIENADLAEEALDRVETGADFADALIALLAERANCRTTMTFDHKASRQSGMTLIT